MPEKLTRVTLGCGTESQRAPPFSAGHSIESHQPRPLNLGYPGFSPALTRSKKR
jgi:hypothetical protein